MEVINTHLKNSNTGELMQMQEFAETTIKSIPIYFYGLDGKLIGENLNTDGFVEISEKKWNRLKRKNLAL